MKKVLIICDTFPPQFAPRMGYLCKYLGDYGYEAYVVSGERLSTRADFASLAGFAKEVHITPQKKHREWNLLHIWPFLFSYDYLRGEYDLRKSAVAICQRVKPDVVLACPSGLFPLCTAQYVSQKFNLPLCVDYRDLIEEQFSVRNGQSIFRVGLRVFINDFVSKRLTLKRRNRLLRRADAVSSISPWYRERVAQYNRDAYLIYNGYDPEKFVAVVPLRSPKFEIAYVGTLSSVMGRNPTLLFKAIKKLSTEGVFTSTEFRVKFYSGHENYKGHEELAVKLGVKDYVEFLDYVPSDQVPDILSRASLLLVLARDQSMQTHGVMTTKLFEYLAMNRPILCVPGDGDCKDAILRDYMAGEGVHDVNETAAFIREKFCEWKRAGVVQGHTDLEKVKIFSRREQAGQFVQMFEDAIRRHAEKEEC